MNTSNRESTVGTDLNRAPSITWRISHSSWSDFRWYGAGCTVVTLSPTTGIREDCTCIVAGISSNPVECAPGAALRSSPAALPFHPRRRRRVRREPNERAKPSNCANRGISPLRLKVNRRCRLSNRCKKREYSNARPDLSQLIRILNYDVFAFFFLIFQCLSLGFINISSSRVFVVYSITRLDGAIFEDVGPWSRVFDVLSSLRCTRLALMYSVFCIRFPLLFFSGEFGKALCSGSWMRELI